MHIVLLIIYGMTIWLSAIAYVAITGNGTLWVVLCVGPFIVSGAILVLILLDVIISIIASAWRARRAAVKARP